MLLLNLSSSVSGDSPRNKTCSRIGSALGAFLVVLAFLALLPGCSQDNPYGHVTKILVVSDSMGTGYGIAKPYPDIIAEISGIPVVNNSISGRETSEALPEFENLLMAHSPSHVLILLGTNDARKNRIKAAQQNLGEMLAMTADRHIPALIATVPVYLYDELVNQRTLEISNWINAWHGDQTVDIRGVLGDGSLTLGDLIHPNQKGQNLIAESFLESLAKLGS